MSVASIASPRARELGTPVRGVNWVQTFPGRNAAGEPRLLITMGQDGAGFFVCDVDLRTGHCDQYHSKLPNTHFPTAARDDGNTGVLYVGSAYAGHLHRYDPNKPRGQRTLEDLGAIDPELCSFPCRMVFDRQGMLWIGAYGGCSLTRFDPRNGTFDRFGRMDETDQYFYPLCGDDGTVAGLVKVCNLHVVALDPKTGQKRAVGPVIDMNAAGMGGLETTHLDLVKGEDGLLYIKSREGFWRLRGLETERVPELPRLVFESGTPGPQNGLNALPDGSRVAFNDTDTSDFRRVRITPPEGSDKPPRELTLDWVGDGSSLFIVYGGPDGKVYSASWMPLRLAVCDADGSNMKDLGQCSKAMGDAYSMGNLDGKLYVACYPGSRLSVYDPGKPYRFGEDADANPRDLGRVDNVGYRPRAMVTGPLGRVWVGSIPDYGMWGGTLASYDPATGEFRSHRHIIQDCTPFALEWIAELEQFLIGFSVSGGSGTQPRVSRTGFALWDPQEERAVWTGDFGIEIKTVMALCRAEDGGVYAITHREETKNGKVRGVAELLRIDAAGRRLIERSRFQDDEGWPLDASLQRHGGAVYGATLLRLYRIRPGTVERDAVWTTPLGEEKDYIRAPGPILNRTFFFGSGHRLRAVEIGA